MDDHFDLRSRGIRDPRVLAAMAAVPRDRFLPPEHRTEWRGDHPVPLGFGQTVSQPFIVAWMTQALDVHPGHRVLEIGTGSGYQTAILAELGARVYSIEVVPELSQRAAGTLAALGYDGIELRVGDGYEGWPDAAPFDRILLTAAPTDVPASLIAQLADGGRLVAPEGAVDQKLVTIERHRTTVTREESVAVRFVPMVRG
jgi:protein-L-isoaspartate(D-aspartate) O-methyltransferase